MALEDDSAASRDARDAGLHEHPRSADRAELVAATLVRLPASARHPAARSLLHEGHVRDNVAQRGREDRVARAADRGRQRDLRRHYGKWMPSEGESELRRFAALDLGLFSGGQIVSAGWGRADTIFASGRKIERRKVRKGGLEPPRVFSPQDPESCASANSATFAWEDS